jgi:hypothetical protein
LIVEGRSARSFQRGRWRLVERDPAARLLTKPKTERSYELYDLEADPGERMNLIEKRRDIASDLLKRLGTARVPVKPLAAPPGAPAVAVHADDGAKPLRVSLAFVGAGARRRVTGTLRAELAGRAGKLARVDTRAAGVTVTRRGTGEVAITLDTDPDRVVTLEMVLEGSALPKWELALDGQAWPPEAVHLGALGISMPGAALGLTEEARAVAVSPLAPFVDPRLDLGLYATIDHGDLAEQSPAAASGIAHSETIELMKEWGYVGAQSSAR